MPSMTRVFHFCDLDPRPSDLEINSAEYVLCCIQPILGTVGNLAMAYVLLFFRMNTGSEPKVGLDPQKLKMTCHSSYNRTFQ